MDAFVIPKQALQSMEIPAVLRTSAGSLIISRCNQAASLVPSRSAFLCLVASPKRLVAVFLLICKSHNKLPTGCMKFWQAGGHAMIDFNMLLALFSISSKSLQRRCGST